MALKLLRNASNARLARRTSQTLASHQSAARVGRRPRTSQTLAPHQRAARVGRRPERRSIRLLLVVLLSPMALAACGPSGDSRLVITQSTDAPSGADHKGHLSPGSFTGIPLSIRNTGAGPARGVTVEDVLPAGFHYYELTTLGGNAIRTALTEPDPQGNPTWGTWTIPAGNGDTVSALVLSFKVQATVKPGDYVNQVKLTTSTPVEIDQGTGVGLVVEPRPSLVLAVAAATGQVTTGSRRQEHEGPDLNDGRADSALCPTERNGDVRDHCRERQYRRGPGCDGDRHAAPGIQLQVDE